MATHPFTDLQPRLPSAGIDHERVETWWAALGTASACGDQIQSNILSDLERGDHPKDTTDAFDGFFARLGVETSASCIAAIARHADRDLPDAGKLHQRGRLVDRIPGEVSNVCSLEVFLEHVLGESKAALPEARARLRRRLAASGNELEPAALEPGWPVRGARPFVWLAPTEDLDAACGAQKGERGSSRMGARDAVVGATGRDPGDGDFVEIVWSASRLGDLRRPTFLDGCPNPDWRPWDGSNGWGRARGMPPVAEERGANEAVRAPLEADQGRSLHGVWEAP